MLNWNGMRCSHSAGDASAREQMDQLSEQSSSFPLILDQMKEASDTLQLGIRLFGPKFVEDMASGHLKEEPKSPEQNDDLLINQSNISVFPEMFISNSVHCSWHTKDELQNGEGVDSSSSRQEQSKQSNQKEDFHSEPFRRKRGRPRKAVPSDGESTHASGRKGHHGNSVKKAEVQKAKDSVTEDVTMKYGLLSKRVRGSYRQYSPADKLAIINFGIEHGSTAASRKYSIPESTVRSWSKKKDRFLKLVNESFLEPGAEIVFQSSRTESKSTVLQS